MFEGSFRLEVVFAGAVTLPFYLVLEALERLKTLSRKLLPDSGNVVGESFFTFSRYKALLGKDPQVLGKNFFNFKDGGPPIRKTKFFRRTGRSTIRRDVIFLPS